MRITAFTAYDVATAGAVTTITCAAIHELVITECERITRACVTMAGSAERAAACVAYVYVRATARAIVPIAGVRA